jgi:Skp family chaperone for outer membrane proteins
MARYFIGLGVLMILGAACILARGEPDAAIPEKSSASAGGYQAPDHLRIAVVDIASIFKNDKRFRTKMEEMKIKVNAAQTELLEEQKTIDAQEQKPRPEIESTFSQIADEELVQMKSKMTEKIGKQKAEFMREEGVIYYDTMENIKREIQRCSEKYQINLVIRVNRDPVNPTDRSDILRGINAPIPYFDSSLDITEEVLAALNGKESDAAN